MQLNQLAKHTKSCRSENGPAIAHASITVKVLVQQQHVHKVLIQQQHVYRVSH